MLSLHLEADVQWAKMGPAQELHPSSHQRYSSYRLTIVQSHSVVWILTARLHLTRPATCTSTQVIFQVTLCFWRSVRCHPPAHYAVKTSQSSSFAEDSSTKVLDSPLNSIRCSLFGPDHLISFPSPFFKLSSEFGFPFLYFIKIIIVLN